MIDLTRACSRHRPVLIDFVDRGEVRPETGAALAHLDRCTRCTEIVEGTMLTITALRRLGDDAAAAEPPADAWPRLRIRIEGWRRRPAIMSPLAGVAMSFAIVAVLVLPVRLGGTGVVDPTIATSFSRDTSVSAAERANENAFLARQRARSASGDRDDGANPTGSIYPIRYPDNIKPKQKEVDPAQSTGRPTQAI
ncbi:MAG TPA: hypothetical protein VFJ71_04075 [Candidatus Limnocylindrales bacterium]|nr:hypothetical protein [Candidatus Limnocylindrales bacterium]